MSSPDVPQIVPADHDATRSWRREVAVAAVIIVALELAAVPVGLLWGHIAPTSIYYTGGHQLNLVIGDAKPLARADGWFLVITGVAGLISGIVAYFMVKRAEIGATLGLALGGLAAGWLAWRVGHAWTVGVEPIKLALTPDGTKMRLAPDLGARVVLIAWAVAAVVVHALLYAMAWPSKSAPESAPEPTDGTPAPRDVPAQPPAAPA